MIVYRDPVRFDLLGCYVVVELSSNTRKAYSKNSMFKIPQLGAQCYWSLHSKN